ncbi:hypothetical protein [Sedimentisphaera salicampi]|uniref:Peptidase C-terminal archaeal/bacterial domain-containing protein n=1 Tax=Sedimentisphaera salicampi TaxID=1941349 RepID=A0A1W6LIS5_9BACT|nr:hypothetical protein [Sedimentisphaera salicampi]ARN55665.1 hypothetical protein STSP1_00025 [Sedimentisphaera salicampi]
MFKAIFIVVLFLSAFAVLPLCAETPDFGDDIGSAFSITPDNDPIEGELQTGADIDFFALTPEPETVYRVFFNNGLSDRKNLKVLMENSDYELRNIKKLDSNAETEYSTFYCEYGYPVYFKVFSDYSASGLYHIEVQTVKTVPVDSFSNSCSSPTQLDLSSGYIETEAVIDTSEPNFSAAPDYYTFDALENYRYYISFDYLDSSQLRATVLNSSCSSLVSSVNEDEGITLVSNDGGDFIIKCGHSPYGDSEDISVGNYYCLKVSAEGPLYDDFSNSKDSAHQIIPGDGPVKGTVFGANYGGDIDWFYADVNENSLYRITIDGYDYSRYKDCKIYYARTPESGHPESLIELYSTSEYNAIYSYLFSRDYMIEDSGRLYIRMAGRHFDTSYTVAAELISEFSEDLYPNTMEQAQQIPTDNTRIIGAVLGEYTDPNYVTHPDKDYFYFDTQDWHKYEVRVSKSDNANINFGVQLTDPAGSTIIDYHEDQAVLTFVDTSQQDKWYICVENKGLHLGGYYEFTVRDLGSFPDDRPSNFDSSDTFRLPTDGTWYGGSIDYYSDRGDDSDLLLFDIPVSGEYTFNFYNKIYRKVFFKVYYWDTEYHPAISKFDVSRGETVTKTHNFPTAGLGRIVVSTENNYTGDYFVSIKDPLPRCGDGYAPPPGDTNEDCYVDFQDVAAIAEGWLNDTNP